MNKNLIQKTRTICVLACAFLVYFSGIKTSLAKAVQDPINADLIVYGGTAAGVTAAVAASRMGSSVIIVEPQVRVGGMISGGLIRTDIGDAETIGGLSKEFFDRNYNYYVTKYGKDSRQVERSRNGFFTEPSVAELIFNEMIGERPDITVMTGYRLVSAATEGRKITSIVIEKPGSADQPVLTGNMFIDASYEGDLMAAAGVPYRVGRESQAEYGESFAGVNYVYHVPPNIIGAGDHKLQAYNIRGVITNREDIRVLFPRPGHYDPEPFTGIKQKIIREGLTKMEEALTDLPGSEMPNHKHDNNDGDIAGVNYAYPEGSWEERKRIYERVKDHWLSLFYMLQNDPDLPEAFRKDARKWGLPSDEFPENGHVTPQLYVREARRMIGQYVLTQLDILYDRYKESTICLGSYNIDSHAVDHIMTEKGLRSEGGFVELCDPYEIPYGVIVPPVTENLLVVCDISATHIAYGSVRMEPVFMMLGHAGGIAAHLALASGKAVQDVNVATLQSSLKKQGAILDAPYLPDVEIRFSPEEPKVGEEVTFSIGEKDVRDPLRKIWWSLDGSGSVNSKEKTVKYRFTTSKIHQVRLLVEDENGLRSSFITANVPVGDARPMDVDVEAEEGTMTGEWIRSRSPNYDFRLLYTDGNAKKGEKKVRFVPDLPKEGRYLVTMAYSPGVNRADKVPVTIKHKDGTKKLTLDQSKANTIFVYKPLGEFVFQKGKESWVEISNASSDGLVVADAIKWVWLGEADK